MGTVGPLVSVFHAGAKTAAIRAHLIGVPRPCKGLSGECIRRGHVQCVNRGHVTVAENATGLT